MTGQIEQYLMRGLADGHRRLEGVVRRSLALLRERTLKHSGQPREFPAIDLSFTHQSGFDADIPQDAITIPNQMFLPRQ